MAKNKEEEACYKAEGLRRMKIRKAQRILNLIDKQKNRYDRPWSDPSSPTGWYQMCDYQGICEFPCNGDC